VPVARDVDCAGGQGNGPAYVQGPFNYEGEDVYGLDADDIACEPKPRTIVRIYARFCAT
jgi:hypothetical protein